MISFYKILIFFLHFIHFTLSDNNSDCRSIEYLQTHPLQCCIYPQFSDNTPATANKCAQMCKNNVRYSSFSCQRICIIKETGIIDENGNVDIFAVVKFFFDSLNELSSKWKPIVRNSVKICENEFPLDTDLGDEKQLSFCYKNLIECVRKMNFINCPNLSNSGDCGKMKVLMAKCDTKNYDFLHKILFEEIYNRGYWKPEMTTNAASISVATKKEIDINKNMSTTKQSSSNAATKISTLFNLNSSTIKSNLNSNNLSQDSSTSKQTTKDLKGDQILTTVGSWSTNIKQRTTKMKN